MTIALDAKTPGHELVAEVLAGKVVTDGDLLTTPGVLAALHDEFVHTDRDDPRYADLRALGRRLEIQFAPAVRLGDQLASESADPWGPLLSLELAPVAAVSRHQARLSR